MPVTKLIVNTSNLHVGGGIQVAASFLYEVCRHRSLAEKISVVASAEVDNALCSLGCVKKFASYEVSDVYGIELPGTPLDWVLDTQDVVFTIFGPLYRWRVPFRSVVGFAQPWIIYPNNECYAKLSFIQRVRTRLKFKIQALFFRRADVFVVELEHVKQGLIRELGISPERIHVVHNCISSVYLNESLWQACNMPETDGYLRLGFLGRNYIHKNTAIFPEVVRVLTRQYGINARFYVTFTEEEWEACSAEFRAVCINIGPLAVAQCPTFYQHLDAVVFASLLECFSVTPLEAMVMEKPLFASDRLFNRDVCADHAVYFDPLSPESAASAIAEVFSKGGLDKAALRAAREHAIKFSNAAERAEKYLDLLSQYGDETENFKTKEKYV